MSRNEIVGRCLVPGHASGDVVFTDVPLSFWMGIDTESGAIIDRHHPLCGTVVTGKIFVLPGARGSCSGSCGLLELIHNDKAPAALVFAEDEAILTMGAMIGGEIFGKTIPIAAVDSESFARLAEQKSLTVDNGRVAVGRVESKGEIPTPTRRVNLTASDQAMLEGAEGKARQVAMRVIARFAEVQGVTELIDVGQAHIDCCFYTGPAGLGFAEQLNAWGGKVKVPATTNATSVDTLLWRRGGVEASFGEISQRVIAAYTGIGVRPSFTCAPYLLESAPGFGQQIAWGESNAVAYANSVLGARTMKYPDYLDILVALTGRAPLMASHTAAGRQATVRIDVPDLGITDDSFHPLLGYHVGLIAGSDIPVVTGLADAPPSRDDLKAFSAAFATTAGAPMFHIAGVTPEAETVEQALGDKIPERHVVLTRADLLQSWRELNTATDPAVELVSLGNPHFSRDELGRAAALCSGKTKAAGVDLVITCGRDIYREADQAGLVDELKRFGANILNDTCWCMIFEPMLPRETRRLMTNSAKFAHYGPGITRREMHFASLEACIAAACSGRNPGDPPDWLRG
ncbi:aconitase X [Dongia sp.]|uniref:cis-3-hydroxy-L-proline dehydratase n=1 Tax=Dongia sp. TaxID=1977262 RepID=UPI0037525D7A